MGRSIREVWDYRLSTAQPMNHKGAFGVTGVPDSNNWIACIYDQGENGTPLEVHDTGIPATTPEDQVIDTLFAFYRSVRDKYSRPNIESLKPEVAKIRSEQDKIIEINAMGGQ